MSGQPERPGPGRSLDYVTVTVADQLFGLPIGRVHDVFVTGEITPVPLAQASIAGLVHLRGRIVTAIDLRLRFGLRALARPAGSGSDAEAGPVAGRMTVGIEAGQEHYGLIVDGVGEVLRLAPETREDLPAHLSGPWADLSCGLHRLDDRLLVVLDLDRIIPPPDTALAA